MSNRSSVPPPRALHSRQRIRATLARVAAGAALATVVSSAFALPATAGTIPADVNLTPAAVTDGDITNPMRGQYRWMGYGSQIEDMPTSDVYFRDQTYWGRLEPSRGTYNWAPVEQMLSSAASTNGIGGLRVMTSCPGCWMNSRADWPGWGPITPAWLPTQAGSDFPDWNSEVFLSSWESLMKAMGDKYRDDPRLSYLDVGGYGAYGEEQDGSGTPITDANYARLVKAVATNFPNKWVLVNTITAPQRIKPALDAHSNVGMRIDNLGCRAGAAGEMYSWVPVLPELQNYWKTRPFITEYCTSADLARAAQQVKDWHISTISSGNFRAGLADQGNLSAFKAAVNSSGYRYRVASLTIPGGVTTDGASGTLTWANDGVAPAYRDWNATLILTDSDGGKTQIPLDTKLRQVLPGTAATQFAIPAGLTAGTYTASVIVKDAAGYLPTMNLANAARQADGSYTIGTFDIVEPSVHVPSNGTVSGNVFEDVDSDAILDAGEPGQGGYRVTLLDAKNAERTIQTAADGAYSFADVAPGQYTVKVALAAPFTSASTALEAPVTITDGDMVTGINFGLKKPVVVAPKPGHVTGNVFEDLDGDAAFDGGEPGQAAYDVTLTGDGGFTRTVKTKVNGSFTFETIQPGTYTVTVALRAPFTGDTTGLSKQAVIIDGNTVAGVNFGLTQPVIIPTKPGTVSGNVFEDIDKDATFDAGEPRIGGYDVTLVKPDATEVTITSDTDGSYAFVNVAPGEYNVKVSVTSPYTASTTALSQKAVVVDGDKVEGLNFGLTQPPVVILPKPGTISGSLFEDVDRDGVVDDGELGIDAYTVNLALDGGAVLTTLSNPDGTFTFNDVAPGSYKVSVNTNEAYPTATTTNSQGVTIVDGDKVTGITFGLAKPVVIDPVDPEPIDPKDPVEPVDTKDPVTPAEPKPVTPVVPVAPAPVVPVSSPAPLVERVVPTLPQAVEPVAEQPAVAEAPSEPQTAAPETVQPKATVEDDSAGVAQSAAPQVVNADEGISTGVLAGGLSALLMLAGGLVGAARRGRDKA